MTCIVLKVSSRFLLSGWRCLMKRDLAAIEFSICNTKVSCVPCAAVAIPLKLSFIVTDTHTHTHTHTQKSTDNAEWLFNILTWPGRQCTDSSAMSSSVKRMSSSISVNIEVLIPTWGELQKSKRLRKTLLKWKIRRLYVEMKNRSAANLLINAKVLKSLAPQSDTFFQLSLPSCT